MRNRTLIVPALALGAALLSTAGGRAAQSFNIAPIDVPCSTCGISGIMPMTTASGINPSGDVVGTYKDPLGGQHGFLRRDGQFTSIDVPGALAGVSGTLPTAAKGISPSGDVVGQYIVPASGAPIGSPAYCPAAGSVACIKGFLLRNGKFSTVLFPGHPGAIPQRITPDGDIYGCYHDYDLMMSMFGFVRTRFAYDSLAAGGGELADSTQSVPMSMNNGATPGGRTIIGLWTDMMTNHTHGYVVKDGVFQSYDVPGVVKSTAIWDINPSGDFVGTYVDSVGQHAFVQLADGSTPTTLNLEVAVAMAAFGINPSGVIVGQYSDATKRVHGFAAVPAINE
jgi:hypothetical protein